MSKPKIILVGAGGHCRSCIDVIEQEGRFEIAGLVGKEIDTTQDVCGYPLIGTDDDMPELRRDYDYALVAVGQIKSSAVRRSLVQHLRDAGFELPIIVSPFAYVSQRACLGEGTIVMHGAIINAGARVGENCILNSRCLVEHNAKVGRFVHVSTGAILNGEVSVSDDSFIGSGAVVVDGVSLPEYSFARAGQLIVSDKDVRITKDQ